LRFPSSLRAIPMLLLAALLLPSLARLLAPVPAIAQDHQPLTTGYLLEEHAVKKVSDHVYVIPSRGRGAVPNVGIIVGSRATLVVDTGMGPRSGEIIVREVQRLTKNPALYLVTTHFHPEHISGEQAFPPNTVWIIPEAQKEDIDQSAMRYVNMFSQRSPEMKALLQDVKLREPDIVFDQEAKIDLGGVTARVFWLGPAHTHGDTLVMVEEDSVLLPGDIVQNKLFPNMPDATANVANWLVILDKLEALHPRWIVPDHGDETGDASLIGKEREVLKGLQTRSRELKAQGKSAEEAGQTLTAEFKARYPDWTNPNAINNIVLRCYAESQ